MQRLVDILIFFHYPPQGKTAFPVQKKNKKRKFTQQTTAVI